VRTGHPAQEIVVGVEAFGRLALGPLDLGLFQLRCDRADHACGNLVLQVEDVSESAVEVVGPQVGAGRGVQELGGDAYPLGGLAHAAFHHVAHAQLAAHLLHISGPALVREARIAGDHEQPAHVAQRGDDVLDDAVREVFLLRVVAHVLERQHRDRRLVRKCRPGCIAGETDQAIAAAGHGNQVALAALLFVEDLSQGGDLDLEIVLLDD
jgi:hypothetical protein